MPIRSFAAVLAVLVVFSAAPGGAHAQTSTAQAPGAQVTGAAGFAWGTTRAAIMAERGAPITEQPDAEGVTTLVYDDRVLGREVVATFFVHPQIGLMRVSYMAPVSGAADCGIAIQLFDNVVSRRYPDLQTQERTMGYVPDGACAAALAGRGGYVKIWRDLANGARIMLVVLPRTKDPMLTYTTAEADAWERRKDDVSF